MKELLKPVCFTYDWLINKSSELSGDPTLIEKTVHAFSLLGYLVQLEDNFIFKGGTSLLLHIPKIKRLSIDIDIVFGGNMEKFVSAIAEISGNAPFIRFEEDIRSHQTLPNRKHFKFFYNSILSKKEDYVLLDIVLENPSYILYETKAIKTGLFETEIELSVKVPTVEGLLGDKLIAFAPHTIGVPFEAKNGNSMVMQVVKQLYDIGELFDIASNFQKIQMAYQATFEKENEYNGNKFYREQVLLDTIDTCLSLLRIRLKGFKKDETAKLLEEGIFKISSHLLGDKFSTDNKAKITASKVFCIANLLLNNKTLDFRNDRYNSGNIDRLANIDLPAPYSRLNRLKPILPEAFYYIWQGIK